jgi:hypothetical protein
MNRLVSHEYSSAISYAFGLLSYPLVHRLQYIHFLTGTDPIYAGLHRCEPIGDDKRSYRNTAHVSYPWNAINKRGQTTVVLPLLTDADPYTIIHELGHCLDEVLGFEHEALPINDYAKTNRLEAFAEAFACQYFWLGRQAEDIFQSDVATRYLFKQLGEIP